MRPARLLRTGTALVLAVAALGPALPAAASHDPEAVLLEAHGFQNLLEDGDLMVLIRYELVTADWQFDSSPHEFMSDATCDDANDLDDPCRTSLVDGIVTQTFYNGAQGGTGVTLAGERDLPRIDHGLNAVYLEAGHGLTFGDVTYETCIEHDSNTFSGISPSCETLQWHSSADREANRTVMETQLPQIMLNLEDADDRPPSTYVITDRITETGAIFALEAFTAMVFVAPSAFFAGTGPVFDDIAATPDSQLGSDLTTSAEGTTVFTGTNALTQSYMGVGVRTGGSMLTLLVGGTLLVHVLQQTRSATYGMLAAGLIVGWAALQAIVPIEAVFATISAMIVIGGAWLFTRQPA